MRTRTTYVAVLLLWMVAAGNALAVEFNLSDHGKAVYSQVGVIMDRADQGALEVGNVSDYYNKMRSLLKFDIASIPAGQKIDSAVLHLFIDGGSNPSTAYVYRGLEAWTGSEACWNRRSGTAEAPVYWNAANLLDGPMNDGVAFASVPTASGSVVSQYTWTNLDVLEDVRAWYTGTAANYGWMIKNATVDESDPAKHWLMSTGYSWLEINYSPATVTDVSLSDHAKAISSSAAIITNSPDQGDLQVGKLNDTYDKMRSLLKFNLSSIPAGQKIESAVLCLFIDGGSNPSTAYVYRGLEAWTGTEACWNRRLGTTENPTYWNAANLIDGPLNDDIAFASIPTASASVTGQYTWTRLDVLSDVQAWYSGSAANCGWMIKNAAADESIVTKLWQMSTAYSYLKITYSPAPVTQAPVFSPVGPEITGETLVTISSATPGAKIYYTTNGNTPKTSGTEYPNPTTVTVTDGTTLKAIAVLSDTSIMTTQRYVFARAAAPTFTPAQSDISGPTPVTIACDIPGATIRYTLDGTEPTINSPVYEGPLTVCDGGQGRMTLKAAVVVNGVVGFVRTQPYSITTQNMAFDVPAVVAIHVDGDLSDWSKSTPWSHPFILWNAGGLSSVTQAKFAWNDAQDILYVAVRTNQANGGHVVVGISTDVNAAAWSETGNYATQLAFNAVSNDQGGLRVTVMNEITEFSKNPEVPGDLGLNHKTTNVTGAAVLGSDNYYTYELAIPAWTNWVNTVSRTALENKSKLYVYCVIESGFGTGIGMNMTHYDNPNFATAGGFSYGSTLTLKAVPGDANGDGMVDVGDLGILAANYGGSSKTWANGDFNGDRSVDVGDLGILAANYGTNASGSNWTNDYAKAFGTTATVDDTEDETLGSSMCSSLGLPLIAGLALMGLMLVKLEE